MDRWTLGEVFILRHAGFPFEWVEALGFSEGLLAQVEALLAEEEQLLAAVEARSGAAARVRTAEGLQSGRPPSPAPAPLVDAVARWRAKREALAVTYTAERAALRERLHQTASDLGVQEAVFLSSPDMFDNVWTRYVQAPVRAETSDVRRVERQVYSYVQRFCAKNETTSFFGPMGYGEIAGDGEIEVTPNPDALRRRTFLAFWAVQELARAVGREPSLKPHLPLRRNPIFRFTPGQAACPSVGLKLRLKPEHEQLLTALDVPRTATEVAAAMGLTLEEVELRVAPLLKGTLLVRGLSFEEHDFEAFTHLRQAVAALPEGPARARWEGQLERLDGLRATFEAARFPARREALLRLEAAFTEVTGLPARRGEGQMYSDRLVIYEEADSPFRLRFGQAYARRLEEALTPGLELSAAFGEQVQRRYREEVVAKLGPDTSLDFLSYAARLRPEAVSGSEFSPVAPLKVKATPGVSEQTLTPPESLPARSPGGRFALPDVCLSGTAGPGGQVVPGPVLLARVHHHLLLWSWLCAFHPDRGRVAQVAERWLSKEPSARSLTALAFSRRNKGFYAYPGRKVAYTAAEAAEFKDRALPASELEVKVDASGPRLLDRAGMPVLLYLPLADFSTYPPFAALAHPLVLHAPLTADGGHLPRTAVGGATYQRERWHLELNGWGKLAGLELFLALQREVRARRCPRFLFARVRSERKPFLIDLRSPFAAENLKHAIRSDPHVSFEEMLPAPDQLWLRDGRGRYTFELRMQATCLSSAVSGEQLGEVNG